jgi:L-threonylcarbamoyladenylate synthase
MGELASVVTPIAATLANHFFPGPLTIVLKKSPRVPLLVTAGLDTVGIRMPRQPIAAEFLAQCGTPVAAPSANLSGRPSPTTWQAVMEDLDGRIDCILQGEHTEIGLESTVVDCTDPIPIVLRLGAISFQEIREIVPEAMVVNSLETDLPAMSPGLKHQHYSPTAKVIIVNENLEIDDAYSSAYIGISARDEPFTKAKICSSVGSYARELFEFFRECDREGIKRIYCERVSAEGIGAALMDRIERAAQR